MRRGIVIIYLLLFITAFLISGFNLKAVIHLKPIPLISFLKHTLLCVLFLILIVNAAKSLTLKQQHLDRFRDSIKNLKWLFALALVISLFLKMGLGNPPSAAMAAIGNIQLGILFLLGVFCFWSDAELRK